MHNKAKQSAPMPSISNIAAVIKKLLSRHKLSLVELHKRTGVPLTTLKRIKNNPAANPTISSLLPLADFFTISVSQLLGIYPLPDDTHIGAKQEKRDLWRNVPILSWEQASTWQNSNSTTAESASVSTDCNISANAFALQVVSDQWPGFLQNSILIVDAERQPTNNDYVIAHKHGTPSVSLYRWLTQEDTHYLKPPCPDFNTVIFDKDYVIKGVLAQIRIDT